MKILKNCGRENRNWHIVHSVEVKFAKYLCDLGYKHNTVIKNKYLNNSVTCPVFHDINLYRWINQPNTFATKWKYNISYIHPDLVSKEFNYLARFLYPGKYGTISKGEEYGIFPKSYYDI